jgi:hypothetical protein
MPRKHKATCKMQSLVRTSTLASWLLLLWLHSVVGLQKKRTHNFCVLINNNLDGNKIVHIVLYDFNVLETRVEHDWFDILCVWSQLYVIEKDNNSVNMLTTCVIIHNLSSFNSKSKSLWKIDGTFET